MPKTTPTRTRDRNPKHVLPARLTVSVAECAQMLGIAPATAWHLANTGRIPSAKLGGRRLIRLADLEALVDSLFIADGTDTDDAAAAAAA